MIDIFNQRKKSYVIFKVIKKIPYNKYKLFIDNKYKKFLSLRECFFIYFSKKTKVFTKKINTTGFSLTKIIITRVLALIVTGIFVSSCSNNYSDIIANNKLSADQLYENAICSLDIHMKDAIKQIDILEIKYPHYENLENARILKIFAYYKYHKFDDASLACDEFLRIYPSSINSPYIHYMRAMSYYDQILDMGRDQQITEKAQKYFSEIIIKYPQTDYAKDSIWKLEYIFNVLAAKEADIGRFYLKNGDYISAINRFKLITHQYDTSMLIPETLYRLAEAYHGIGLNCQAEYYIHMLQYNFPDNKWYKQALLLQNSIKKDDKTIENHNDKFSNKNTK